MSIRQRKSKKSKSGFTYQVYFSYTDSYTKQKKNFSKSGFLTYEDASLYEKKKKQELNLQQLFIKQYKVTIDQVFHEWLNLEAVYRYQENTIIDYKNRYYKHIKQKLGNILLQDIDYRILQVYFNENSKIGLSTNYKLKEVLNVIINFAIKCNYINHNPLSLVHVIGQNNSRTAYNKIFQDNDFENVINELKKINSFIRQSYIIALYIGKYTGLRISEVFALDREDFNFSSQQIYITKKIVYANKKRSEIFVSNQLKTKTSQSSLPFHKDLQKIILKWLSINTHKHVICDKKGNYLNPKQLEYTLWKISKDLNIHFHFHMLRHTLATRLVHSGADIKATQEILRHANVVTTMNIYTHANEELKKEAIYKAFPINVDE